MRRRTKEYFVTATPDDNPGMQPAIEIFPSPDPGEFGYAGEYSCTDEAHDAVLDAIRTLERFREEMNERIREMERQVDGVNEELRALRALERDLEPHF